jgi:predicted ATPase
MGRRAMPCVAGIRGKGFMSETQETHDHMGRKIVHSKSAMLQQDLPWIIATALLTVFCVMALAGYFRL